MKLKTTDIFMIICALGAVRTMNFLSYLILGGCAILLFAGFWIGEKQNKCRW
ncbi:hypothetical protein [Acidaminococcus timonensis]|uniref:hypothetical protein n=1 Tax=Acidaminococcus timonensis TaxID=1871002 RepID=UPI0015B75980|nr:hypothetical protein [Acidaminococcus timonensis]